MVAAMSVRTARNQNHTRLKDDDDRDAISLLLRINPPLDNPVRPTKRALELDG